MYDITTTHFRDMYGRFLWAEPLKEEYRLYAVGEEFIFTEVRYRIERVALTENTQHVNVVVLPEQVNIVEPYL